MKLRAQQSQWDQLGRSDPLWAIITDPRRRNGGWNLDEFFATGMVDARRAMEWVDETGCPAARNTALDFGCGVGRVTQALGDYFEHVTGVDIAPAMLDLARQYNRRGERCRYVLNNQNHLRVFGDASFDFIHSRITLQHVPRRHIRSYLREFVRVLRPGGLIVFQLPAKHRYRDISHFLVHNVYKALARKILRVPTVMEMYRLPQQQVIRTLEDSGARVLQVLDNTGPDEEWISLEYLATR
ncbi:MAG TPA: methyltransferase domain-containing protein [Bryobacteraceae bacterium]|nr:methyltransferase domain-containing protein [Bryobacteraceae bacterium]